MTSQVDITVKDKIVFLLQEAFCELLSEEDLDRPINDFKTGLYKLDRSRLCGTTY